MEQLCFFCGERGITRNFVIKGFSFLYSFDFNFLLMEGNIKVAHEGFAVRTPPSLRFSSLFVLILS